MVYCNTVAFPAFGWFALARRMGATHVVNVAEESLDEAMRAEGIHEGFDIGLEMSGAAPAFRDMIDKMNNGGKIAILGIAQRQPTTEKELSQARGVEIVDRECEMERLDGHGCLLECGHVVTCRR